MRYYVLTLFTVVIGAVLGAWQWLSHEDKELRIVVLLVAAAFSAVMALFDRVNAGHIRKLCRLGKHLERRPGALEPGIFETIQGSGRILGYGRVLLAVYCGATASFLVVAAMTAQG